MKSLNAEDNGHDLHDFRGVSELLGLSNVIEV